MIPYMADSLIEIEEGVKKIIEENHYLAKKVANLTQENYNLRTELEVSRSREIMLQKKALEHQFTKMMENINAARRIEGCNQETV